LKAKIHKIIEPEEVFEKTGYSRPHTIHCGPEGIYVSTLGGGGPDGTDGPPGIFIMDCQTFEIIGRYEMDRGKQDKHYDFWWNLPQDYMVSSEWGLPPQFENGIVPDDLLSNKYGHSIHFWDLRARKNIQTMDFGANHQMALEIRPAHDPSKSYRLLRRRGRHDQPAGRDLHMVARRGRQMAIKENHHHRPGSRRCRRSAGAAQGLWCGAAVGHRYRSEPG
jgi:hypothetical protein